MTVLSGSRVLLTGAGGGLGEAIGAALVHEGASIVLSDRDRSRLERLARTYRTTGVPIGIAVADLQHEEEATRLAEEANDAFGGIDILVNNAGVEVTAPYADLASDDVRAIVSVNLMAPMLLTRALLPAMLDRGRGHCVQISSLAGKSGVARNVPYCTTKAGLFNFSAALRADYPDQGVGFSVVAPGFISGEGQYARMVRDTGAQVPAYLRAGSPADVARAVVRAIRANKPEVIVNRLPVRPLLALGQLFPGALARGGAADDFMREVTERRARGLPARLAPQLADHAATGNGKNR